MSILTPFTAGILYIVLAAIPGAIAVISWRNREKSGAVPLFVTGLTVGTASVVQGFRFFETAIRVGNVAAVSLHILLLIGINLAVMGAMYIAVEYTNRRFLARSWVVGIFVLTAVILPVGRILSAEMGLSGAGRIANADFLYRVLLASAGLYFFVRQLFGSRGMYRKQTATLLVGLSIGSGFGLLERFYSVPFVEFTLLGMVGGCVILGVALFRYEFLETAPIARETLFDHVSDPVVALDATGHVADINRAASETFGIQDSLVGATADRVFDTDSALAAAYEERFESRADFGGVVVDGQRHFDPDHPLVARLRAGERIDESGVEMGLLADGEIKYYTVSGTEFALAPEQQGQLVIFREITTERERAEDLEVLKQVLVRVLRHNLRNEVTVIRGFADSIAERTNGETADNAERIVGRTEALINTSETARRIKNVIDTDELLTVSLPELVERTVDDARSAHPEASYEFSVPPVRVSVNPEFDRALAELLGNAARHTESDDVQVQIDARETGEWVELTVADDGPGIPEYELDVLDRGEETSLVHGSGAGLWLVQTAVEHSNGDVSYETSDDGTTVRIRLPVADD